MKKNLKKRIRLLLIVLMITGTVLSLMHVPYALYFTLAVIGFSMYVAGRFVEKENK